MNSALLEQAIENLLPPTPIQTTSGIGTKRRKPSASLHAYKVCKLKQDPAPYVHHFSEDQASKRMNKSTWSEIPPSTEESPIEFTGTHGPKGKAVDANLQSWIHSTYLLMKI